LKPGRRPARERRWAWQAAGFGLGDREAQLVMALQDAAAAGHLPEQEDAGPGKEQVGRPHGEESGNPVLTAQGDAGQREEVIEKTSRMVKTKPELLPPRREATPSGTPTSISTRQAAG
jgi:hypothetical protein